MKSKEKTSPLGPAGRGLCAALAAVLLIETSGCASAYFTYYNSTPLYYSTPDKLLVHSEFDGTQVSLGAIFCYRKDLLFQFFPTGAANALWRENVLPVLISVKSDDPTLYNLNQNFFNIQINGKYYMPIPPGEAFDLAWQSKRAFITVQKGFYYTGLILFTVFTLGLGSMIWVLPSPFSQPSPSLDPFGRDLNYKAFPQSLTLHRGMLAGGMLYFHYSAEEKQQQDMVLNASLVPSSFTVTANAVKSVSLAINAASPDDSNRVLEWMQGFFY